MLEDKLSREERIRLEALSQAMNLNAIWRSGAQSAEGIIHDAKQFEKYVIEGSSDGGRAL